MRVRAISGTIGTRNLASITYAQHARRVVVTHSFDPLLKEAFNAWAKELKAETVVDFTERRLTTLGYIFKSQLFATFYAEIAYNYRLLGILLLREGREWVQ